MTKPVVEGNDSFGGGCIGLGVAPFLRAGLDDALGLGIYPRRVRFVVRGWWMPWRQQRVVSRAGPFVFGAATKDPPDEGVDKHAELAAAIHRASGKLAQVVVFDDGHPFSSHRIALADTLVHWCPPNLKDRQLKTLGADARRG